MTFFIVFGNQIYDILLIIITSSILHQSLIILIAFIKFTGYKKIERKSQFFYVFIIKTAIVRLQFQNKQVITKPMSATQYEPFQDRSNMKHKAHGKCVCQACNCGKHKCPDPLKKGDFHSSYNADYPKYQDFKPQGKYKLIQKNFILPQDKFYGSSSYTDDYIQKGGAKPVEKFVPKGEIALSKDPFQANTSYIQDYLNRGQGQRAEKVQLPKNFVMPEGRFDGNTNYHDNYLGGKGQRQQQFRPSNQLKTGGQFQGVSSYLADYENKGVGSKAQRVPLPKNQIMPQGKFDGLSNYTSNYVPNKAQKLQQIRPEGQLKVGGNFEGSSSYGNDYNMKGAGQRAQKVQLPNNQIMPEGRFQGNSNYTDSYIPNRAQKQQQIRPQGELKIGGDFQGQSSYLADYMNRGVGVKAQRVPLPKNQVLPQGRFQGDSVYTANYVPSKSERQQQIRPQGELKIGGNFEGASSYLADYDNKGAGQRSQRIPLPKNQVMPDGRFDGATSYTNDYLNKGTPVRAERVPLPRNQIMPDGKFQTNTTYAGDYVPGQGQRSPQVRPDGQLKVGGKFQGNSTYVQTYTGAKMPKHENCPCEELHAPRHQIAYKEHVRFNQKSQRWE